MTSPRTLHHPAVLAVVLAVLLVALPAGALEGAVEAEVRDAMVERTALERLDALHQLPEVLDYVPPAPWYADELSSEGLGYEFDEVDTNAIMMSTEAPMDAKGTAKVLSLAIEFTDVKHNGANTVTRLKGRLTGANSMRSYYEEVSYGQLTIEGDAHGWYTANNDMAYYGAPHGGRHDSQNFYKLVAEAVRAADPYVDFSKYDTNYDRFIDNICLVHAGRDEATGGGSDAIWSKQSTYPGTLRVDGVYLGHYFTVSESSPVGVYVHEFGHMLGLPDLYDTDYTSIGVGVWDVMGSGAWNNYGRTPAHLSAWSKMALGWVEPTVISNYVEGRELKYMAGDEPEIIKLPTSDSTEFFLLENRYKGGYDVHLPGSGLLIWHIDTGVISNKIYSNTVNTNEFNKGVDLEEASGTQDLDSWSSGNDGDSNDPWKNTVSGFSSTSVPDSRLYDGTDTKIRVSNISYADLTMTIDIDFGGGFAVFLDTIASIREVAPDQTVVHNVTVGTRSSEGDTIYLSLQGTHVSWGYLDPKHSSLSLGSKESSVVRLEITPPAGTPKGVEGQVILEARSQRSGLTAQLETTTIVKQVHALEADPPSSTVHVEPDVAKHLDIVVTNSGNGHENITLALEADRIFWGAVDPGRVSVGVLESETVRVTFNVPQGVRAGEEEPFTLTMFSEVSTVGETAGQVALVPTLQVDIVMVVKEVVSLRWGNIQDQHILPGGTVEYEISLFNEGNSDVDVEVSDQAPEGWTLEVEGADNLTIPAFQSVTLNATLGAPLDIPAGQDVLVPITAARGVDVFSTTLKVTVDQLYRLSIYGMAARFADPGQRVEFELTVTNLGNGPDRVVLAIAGNGWETEVTPNIINLGTQEQERSRRVHVYMTAPENARAYEENTVTVTLTSGNGELTASHQVTLTANAVSSFSVETEVITDMVDPSDSTKRRATYFVHLDNTGNLEDLFHIGLAGLPGGWTAEFESRMVSVPASKRAMVRFSVLPPVDDARASAGTLQFRVHVASELGNGGPVEKPLSVTVAAHRGHSIRSLQPSYQAPSGSQLTFRVLVVNGGNVPETLVLSAVGKVKAYTYESLEVEMEPFGQRVVNLTVTMPTTDEDRTVDLQVVATTKDLASQEDSPVLLEVEGRPTAPGSGAIAALVALSAVAVAALAGADRRRR